ncbi:MAG: hypothetical protein ACT4PI_09860 [Actinomycetota bacterium]
MTSEFPYTHGGSRVPLIGETIGRNLAKIAERAPDGDALVPCYALLSYDLPMIVTGKIQKFKLRESSIDQLHLRALAAIPHKRMRLLTVQGMRGRAGHARIP